jgi:hypothetical protein
MSFFNRLGIHPLQGPINNPRPDLLATIRYETGTGVRGLPVTRLGLTFQPRGNVANPEMSLALLLDRGFSMAASYAEEIAEGGLSGSLPGLSLPDYRQTVLGQSYRRMYTKGHIYQLAQAILGYCAESYNLIFYADDASFVGPIRRRPDLLGSDLLNSIAAHDPGRPLMDSAAAYAGSRTATDLVTSFGGRPTNLTPALQGAVERYHTRRGLHLVVITNGAFTDTLTAQAYIVNTLLPQITPDNPYAFRLHFIGLGEEVDREFLQQLETVAAGPSVQMVKHHHHLHLGHSHDDIFRELNRAYVGVATEVEVEEVKSTGGTTTLLRVGNLGSGRWFDGPHCAIGFVPLDAQIALEVVTPHPPALDIVIRYTDPYGADQEIPLHVPLSGTTSTIPVGQSPASPFRGFRLPRRGRARAEN